MGEAREAQLFIDLGRYAACHPQGPEGCRSHHQPFQLPDVGDYPTSGMSYVYV